MNEELNTPAEARARLRYVFLLSLAEWIVFAVAILAGYACIPSYYALFVGGTLMIGACVFHNLRLGSWRYLVATFLNTVAAGLAVSAYYAALSLPLQKWWVLAVTIGLLILSALSCFLVSRGGHVLPVLIAVVYIAALVTLIALWCGQPKKEGLYALAAMSQVFFASSLIPYFVVREDSDEVTRTVSFWSFTVALLVALISLVAIAIAGGDCDCDCDCAPDCCDCSGTDGKKKKKR